MPKRTDLKSILIIGAGPIVIGQACEFDYSGAQACKALREEGYRVILVNSNPATIMTDPDMADVTYIEPITWQVVEKIIAKERRPSRREDGAAADHGRPDGAELRARPAQARRAGEVRRRDDRRQRTRHREGRGPAEVQGRDDLDRPRFGQERHRAHDGRGAGGAEAHRRADRRQRLPDGHPPQLHARRHRRRHRLQPGGVRGDLQARPRPVADQRTADRGEPDRLEGVRDGSRPRPRGQLHHRLLDREPRPDGHPHRRLDHGGPGADADRQGIPADAQRHRSPSCARSASTPAAPTCSSRSTRRTAA